MSKKKTDHEKKAHVASASFGLAKRSGATGAFMTVKKRAGRAISVHEFKGEPLPREERRIFETKIHSESGKVIAREAAGAISDEEDAAITRAALADPDAQPVDDLFNRRGRPKLANPKQSVLLRLDPDVVARFKADGEGWQTRMNAALRKAAGLD